jgi:hypothetical protein
VPPLPLKNRGYGTRATVPVPCARAREIWKYSTRARAFGVLWKIIIGHDQSTNFVVWERFEYFFILLYLYQNYFLRLIFHLRTGFAVKSEWTLQIFIQNVHLFLKKSTRNPDFRFWARLRVLSSVLSTQWARHEVGTGARFSRARVPKYMGTLSASTRAVTST